MAKVLVVRLASVVDSVVSSEQTAFIKGKQILDGPLMVNELVSWFKKTKQSMMVLKIDFEKDFDSISWNYLDQVMRLMNFPPRWCYWIKSCLHLARSSVLLNRIPT